AVRKSSLVTESLGTPAREFTAFGGRARGGGRDRPTSAPGPPVPPRVGARDRHTSVTGSAVTRRVAAAAPALGFPVRSRRERAVAERRRARTRRAGRDRRGPRGPRRRHLDALP